MPLFLRKGCFPVDFQEVKRPLRTKSVKRPIKVGERPINEGKWPIEAKVLVGVSVGCLMGCFRAPPLWRKTAPLKRPIKRSMNFSRPLSILDGQNRQSPIASVQRTQSTLASHSAVPRGTNTTPTNANRAIRIAAQRTQGLRGPNSAFFECPQMWVWPQVPPGGPSPSNPLRPIGPLPHTSLGCPLPDYCKKSQRGGWKWEGEHGEGRAVA